MSLLLGESLLNISAEYRSTILAKKRKQELFSLLSSIRLMLEVVPLDTTGVVTSSSTRIALMAPSTCWNLSPQWLEIHGTKANLNPYRIEGMKGKTKRDNGC